MVVIASAKGKIKKVSLLARSLQKINFKRKKYREREGFISLFRLWIKVFVAVFLFFFLFLLEEPPHLVQELDASEDSVPKSLLLNVSSYTGMLFGETEKQAFLILCGIFSDSLFAFFRSGCFLSFLYNFPSFLINMSFGAIVTLEVGQTLSFLGLIESTFFKIFSPFRVSLGLPHRSSNGTLSRFLLLRRTAGPPLFQLLSLRFSFIFVFLFALF